MSIIVSTCRTSSRTYALAAVLTAVFTAGCGEKSGLELEDVTCGELRSNDSWNAVATEQADLVTDGDPRPATVKEYERLFREECAGAPDDSTPLAKVMERREQGN